MSKYDNKYSYVLYYCNGNGNHVTSMSNPDTHAWSVLYFGSKSLWQWLIVN